MIDMKKNYRTRDGKPVRIYAVDGCGSRPVQGATLEKAGWAIRCWPSNGLWAYPADDGPDADDLVEVTNTIICCGNPLEGFEFCGPFTSDAEAVTWAERHCTDTWWIADLDPPIERPVKLRRFKPEE